MAMFEKLGEVFSMFFFFSFFFVKQKFGRGYSATNETTFRRVHPRDCLSQKINLIYDYNIVILLYFWMIGLVIWLKIITSC